MAAAIRHQIAYAEDCLKGFTTSIQNAEKLLKAISEKDAQI
jgi:hypothetical protein